MATGINLSQVQNVSQQLNLAPQLLQWLRLLQANTVDLASLVQRELETNPALELDNPSDGAASLEERGGEEFGSADGISESEPASLDESDLSKRLETLAEIDNEWRDEWLARGNSSSDGDDRDQAKRQFMMDSIAAPVSLHQRLTEQLRALKSSPRERELAELVIGSLDRRGYLATPLPEIAQMAEASEADVEEALRTVQSLGPAGVGARDLRECLMLQLDEKDPARRVALLIARDCFDLLAARNTATIAERLKIGEDEVEEAIERMARLDPEPGLSVARDPAQYVTPDVIVAKKGHEYLVELNDEFIPRLRISSHCKSLLESGKAMSASDLSYLRRKMRNASFLIQGITQRQETLRKVAKEIVRIQRDFLDSKDGALGPLTMGRIARIVGVHETTVSRAISGKYMKTPKGIFEMKTFFRAGYACADGSAMTPEQVRRTIAELVQSESEAAPLTDLQLSTIFKKKGLTVARRTVAKYREELDIPSSKSRGRFSSSSHARRPEREAAPIPA